MKFRTGLVFLVLVLGVGSVSAQRWSVAPFGGFRFGGSLQNSTTGDDVSIKDNLSYGLELDVDPLDSGLKFALLYSHQDTKTESKSLGTDMSIDLDVDQIMVGAIQELYDEKFRPFVGGYVGGTYFDPSGYDSELRFGFGLGVGFNYYINRHLGVRMDLRGFGTVVDSDGGFLCANGGCLVNWSGDVMWQGEVTGSVFISF